MGKARGPHYNVTGLLQLGEQKIPTRIIGAEQKAAFEKPQVCLKCSGTVFRQYGRQFMCRLCGEDVWLVTMPKD